MAQKRNIYAVPKPVGRKYTEQEQELADEIEHYNAEFHRGERAEEDAYGHFRQISNKYRNKPVTPEPPFFVRGNTHPDPEEYKRLLRQEAQHDKETGREEILKHMSLMDQRDTETHRAHMNRAVRIDMLKELIKKNDRLFKADELEEDRKKMSSSTKIKRALTKTDKKLKQIYGLENVGERASKVLTVKTTKKNLDSKTKKTLAVAVPRKKKVTGKPKRKVIKKRK
jgi:hypothetical protein